MLALFLLCEEQLQSSFWQKPELMFCVIFLKSALMMTEHCHSTVGWIALADILCCWLELQSYKFPSQRNQQLLAHPSPPNELSAKEEHTPQKLQRILKKTVFLLCRSPL